MSECGRNVVRTVAVCLAEALITTGAAILDELVPIHHKRASNADRRENKARTQLSVNHFRPAIFLLPLSPSFNINNACASQLPLLRVA